MTPAQQRETFKRMSKEIAALKAEVKRLKTIERAVNGG
jgi:cell division protein FtsB